MRNLSERVRITGLALVAVLALGAIAASSASAELPEFGKCVAEAEGKYTESNCVTKAKEAQPHIFERANAREIVNPKFTKTSGTTFFEGESGIKFICSASSGTGELDEDGTTLAAKGVENVVVKYTGCGIPSFGLQCKSGAVAEEIVTNVLEGNLVYASKAKKEVLQELHPQVKKGAFETFECGGGAITFVIKEGTKGGHNCIFGQIPVANVDVMSATQKLFFMGNGTEAGHQVPQTDEKLKPALCNEEAEVSGGEPEFWAVNQEENLTFEEAIEIFA
jgi:hypothetical protein